MSTSSCQKCISASKFGVFIALLEITNEKCRLIEQCDDRFHQPPSDDGLLRRPGFSGISKGYGQIYDLDEWVANANCTDKVMTLKMVDSLSLSVSPSHFHLSRPSWPLLHFDFGFGVSIANFDPKITHLKDDFGKRKANPVDSCHASMHSAFGEVHSISANYQH